MFDIFMTMLIYVCLITRVRELNKKIDICFYRIVNTTMNMTLYGL